MQGRERKREGAEREEREIVGREGVAGREEREWWWLGGVVGWDVVGGDGRRWGWGQRLPSERQRED